jgi:hypothetical protein
MNIPTIVPCWISVPYRVVIYVSITIPRLGPLSIFWYNTIWLGPAVKIKYVEPFVLIMVRTDPDRQQNVFKGDPAPVSSPNL